MSAGMLGHNGGPTLEPGHAWRTTCWRKARERLLPTLPLEVIRNRVRRAEEIGLDYRTYATVRATTGHDIVAFLFSSNALRLFREGQGPEPERVARVAAQRNVARHLAQQPPLAPERAAEILGQGGLVLDAAGAAPGAHLSFSDLGRQTRGLLGRLPADRVLLVGETALEREWSLAGRLAGWLPAERFFGQTADR